MASSPEELKMFAGLGRLPQAVDEFEDADFPPKHHVTECIDRRRKDGWWYLFRCSCGMTWISRPVGDDLPARGSYKRIADGRRVFARLVS